MEKASEKVQCAPLPSVASPCRSRSRAARTPRTQPEFFPDPEAEASPEDHSISEALELSRKAQLVWEEISRAQERRRKESEQDFGRRLAERDRSLLQRNEALEEAERLAAERRREADAALAELRSLEAEAAERVRLQDARLAEQESELARRREELVEVRGQLEASELQASEHSLALNEKALELEDAWSKLSLQSSKLIEQDQRIQDFRQKLKCSQDLVQELEGDIAKNCEDIEAFRLSLEEERRRSASHANEAEELKVELMHAEKSVKQQGRLHEEQVELAERHAATVEDQRVLLEQLRSAVQRHEQLNREQTASMKEMDQQLASARQAVKDLERLAAGQTEKMVAQKLELESLVEQVQVCKRELAERESTISTQAHEMEQHLYADRERAAIIEAQAQELQDLRAEQKQRQQRHLRREEELAAAREEIEEKQRTLAAQGMELARMRAAKGQAKAGQPAAAEAKSKEIAALKAELEKRAERERALESLVQELQSKPKSSPRQKLLESPGSDKEKDLAEEFAQMARVVAGLREQVSTQDVELREARAKAEAAAMDAAQARARAADFEEQLRRITAEEEELRQAAGKLSQAECKIAEQEKKLATKDEALKDRLEDMEVTVERFQVLQRRAAALEAELEVARQSVEEGEATRKALELDLLVARDDLQDERRRVEEHLAKTLELAQDLESLTMVNTASEDLREQNRELVLTVNQFKRDSELLDAEVRSLKDRLSVFETDLERVTGQHAELTGHINHKQKIKHTMQLKDEISSLRTKLSEAYKRITKLEVDSFGVDFFEALASLGMTICQQELSQAPGLNHSVRLAQLATPRCDQSRLSVATPLRRCRQSSTSQLSVRGPTTSPQRQGDNPADLAALHSLERRCYLQQRAFEKVSVDFGHFLALIERTVYLADAGSAERAASSAGGSPPRVQRPLPELMRKLRDAIASSQAGSADR